MTLLDESVKRALSKAGRKHFFQTNEFISRGLVPGQYHLYADLAACTIDDVIIEFGGSVTRNKIRSQLNELVDAGLVSRQRMGNLAFYWIRNTQYLTA